MQPTGIRVGPGHQEYVLDIVTRYGACPVARTPERVWRCNMKIVVVDNSLGHATHVTSRGVGRPSLPGEDHLM
jgi:hypothetical protein